MLRLSRFRAAQGFCFLILASATGVLGGAGVLLEASLFRAVPYPDPDHLVELRVAEAHSTRLFTSGEWLAIRELPVFEVVEAWQQSPVEVKSAGGLVVRALMIRASRGVSRLVGADVARGSYPNDGGERPELIAVSARLAQALQADKTDVLGQRVEVAGVARTVGAVVKDVEPFPPGSLEPKVWLHWEPEAEESRTGAASFFVIAKLRHGITFEAAAAHVQLLRIQARGGDRLQITSRPFEPASTTEVKKWGGLLAAVGATIVILAVGSLCFLTFIQFASERRNVAIRIALGCRQLGVVKQCAELVAGWAVPALAVGVWLAYVLPAWWAVRLGLQPQHFRGPLRNDWFPAVAAIATWATTLALSAGPLSARWLWQARRNNLTSALSRVERDSGFPRHLATALIAGQACIAVIVLSVLAALASSYARLLSPAIGFDVTPLVLASVATSASHQTPRDSMSLVDALARSQGVAAAAGSTGGRPMSESRSTLRVSVVPGSSAKDVADVRWVTPSYAVTLGLSLARGRFFDGSPDDLDAVVVNRNFARRYWGDRDPVGRPVYLGVREERVTVVGVIEDVRHRGPLLAPRPELLLPLVRQTSPANTVILRSREPGAMAGIAQGLLMPIEGATFTEISLATADVEASTATQRSSVETIGALGVVGTGIAVVGMIGSLLSVLRGRRREILIRAALGARPLMVWRDVVRGSVVGAATAGGCGALAAVGVVDFLGTLLSGVRGGALATTLPVACVVLAAIGVTAALYGVRVSRTVSLLNSTPPEG